MKSHFPILTKNLAYLDSSASTQVPQEVIRATSTYYEQEHANIHRGIYRLSEESTVRYEQTRGDVAAFFGVDAQEIIFTSGTTMSLNMIAQMVALEKGDELIITAMEHHSNFVPWQQLAKQKGLVLHIANVKNCQLDLDHFHCLLSNKTKVVALTHVSNVFGTINPLKEITKAVHKRGALVVVDGAQAVGHMLVNLRELDVDFYACSAHKMYGPTGVGILYGKQNLLTASKPSIFGGGMVKEVTVDTTTWIDAPGRFEAGTPNIAGVRGLGAAITFIQKVGWEYIIKHEQEVTAYALSQLKLLPEVKIYHAARGLGVISLMYKNVHPHDVAQILDRHHVCVRAGTHCAMPLMQTLGVQGTVRVSVGVYTEKNDIDQLIVGLQKVGETFR